MNGLGRGRRAAPAEAREISMEPFRNAVLSDPSPVTGARLAAAVQSSGRLLGTAGTLQAVDSLAAELRGLGPLQQLADARVTDILVNGPHDVWTDGEGGLRRAEVAFGSDADVRALAARLVAAGGRRLDDGNPCADVHLAGYRVHAVLPPVSTGGTLLSIRLHRPRRFALSELLATAPQWQPYLEAIVLRRLNFLICGATGSGKTTMLAALLGTVSPRERMVLVEDAAELNPGHPHVVGLQSRTSNVEGSGAVGTAELVRQALRMRPDRLVVGECRGAEVREFLAAMNTGHAGAGGTIHANAASAVPTRLAAMGALAGMNADSIALQAASALDLVISMQRTDAGRCVQEVCLLQTGGDGRLQTLTALAADGASVRHGPGWDELRGRLFP
ncbi:TadA family conjugal transfer-associated ATPase [Arthrobacter sulfonylureivorans]|uniref:TadA family conjugal transfer-associated ATPase n=1 Tax=Arthrobacter sulfonylureivorans TaxID=2486855 RepID=UPI0039E6FD22